MRIPCSTDYRSLVFSLSWEEREMISRVEGMAKRARDETHLYLKFIGD